MSRLGGAYLLRTEISPLQLAAGSRATRHKSPCFGIHEPISCDVETLIDDLLFSLIFNLVIRSLDV